MKGIKLKVCMAITVTWVVAVMGNGCGVAMTPGGDTESSSLDFSGDFGAEQKTSYGIRTINQVFDNMVSATQYTGSVDTLLTRFESRKSSLSVNGRADSVSAPMMGALASIAVEVCDQLVENQERSQADPTKRRYFKNVDFNQGVSQHQPADNAEDVWVNQMARDFWGRNPSSEELSAIKSSVQAAFPGSGNAAQLRLKTKYVCGAMLASLESNMQK